MFIRFRDFSILICALVLATSAGLLTYREINNPNTAENALESVAERLSALEATIALGQQDSLRLSLLNRLALCDIATVNSRFEGNTSRSSYYEDRRFYCQDLPTYAVLLGGIDSSLDIEDVDRMLAPYGAKLPPTDEQ